MIRGSDVPRVVFVLSLAVLAFLYGYAAHRFGLFPSTVLDRAWEQARSRGSPHFLVPQVLSQHGAETRKPEQVQPGLTLVSSMWKTGSNWTPMLKLVSLDGAVVHAWEVRPRRLFPEFEAESFRPGLGRDLARMYVHGAYLFESGDLLVNVEEVGTARIDACGRVEWTLPRRTHHSIERSEGGNFWIPAMRHDVEATTPGHPDGLPGLTGPIHQDLMLEVAPDGQILDSINVLDVLYGNDLEHHLFQSGVRGGRDLTHLNDIESLGASLADEYDLFDAGDLLVSLRNLDMVLVVDPTSRRVEWSTTDPFLGQHDPDYLGEGWIGVFDNRPDGTRRGTILGGSRIVAVRPRSDSTRILFSRPDSGRFHTSFGGKWQRLPNENLILTEMKAGRVVEVSPRDEVVWQWVHEPTPGSMVPEVYEGIRYSRDAPQAHRLSREEVEDWPCARTP